MEVGRLGPPTESCFARVYLGGRRQHHGEEEGIENLSMQLLIGGRGDSSDISNTRMLVVKGRLETFFNSSNTY